MAPTAILMLQIASENIPTGSCFAGIGPSFKSSEYPGYDWPNGQKQAVTKLQKHKNSRHAGDARKPSPPWQQCPHTHERRGAGQQRAASRANMKTRHRLLPCDATLDDDIGLGNIEEADRTGAILRTIMLDFCLAKRTRSIEIDRQLFWFFRQNYPPLSMLSTKFESLWITCIDRAVEHTILLRGRSSLPDLISLGRITRIWRSSMPTRFYTMKEGGVVVTKISGVALRLWLYTRGEK